MQTRHLFEGALSSWNNSFVRFSELEDSNRPFDWKQTTMHRYHVAQNFECVDKGDTFFVLFSCGWDSSVPR